MKCSKCGGEARFEPKKQGLLCDYCGNFSEINESTEKIDYAQDERLEDELSEYKCFNCGATLLAFDDMAVTFCSYCNSSPIAKSKFEQGKSPDFIIPFKITKSECETIYKKYLKKCIFAPDYMKEEATISKFRGIYIPYVAYKLEKHGKQTNIGGKFSCTESEDYNLELYAINAEIDAEYVEIINDISKNFKVELLRKIAPFNYDDIKPFDIKYLSGFYADIVDVCRGGDAYEHVARKNAKMVASRELTKKVPAFVEYKCTEPQVTFDTCESKVICCPVYFLAIENADGRISYVTINGQTGKVAAQIPVDCKKLIRFAILLAVPIFILLNFFFTLTPTIISWVAIIMSLANLAVLKIQKYDMERKTEEEEDPLDFKWYIFMFTVLSCAILYYLFASREFCVLFVSSMAICFLPFLGKREKKKIEKDGLFMATRFRTKDKAKKSRKTKFIFKKFKKLLPYLSIIIPYIILLINSAKDVDYYFTILGVAIIFLNMLVLVKQHNVLVSTRNPSKFGGR